jgi:hypothetical protein
MPTCCLNVYLISNSALSRGKVAIKKNCVSRKLSSIGMLVRASQKWGARSKCAYKAWLSLVSVADSFRAMVISIYSSFATLHNAVSFCFDQRCADCKERYINLLLDAQSSTSSMGIPASVSSPSSPGPQLMLDAVYTAVRGKKGNASGQVNLEERKTGYQGYVAVVPRSYNTQRKTANA